VNRNESLCDNSTSYTSNTHCILNSESVVSALLCLSLCLSLFCCVCACTCLPSWPIKIHITTHQYQCHPLHSAEIYYLCFSHLPANGLFELNGIIIIICFVNQLQLTINVDHCIPKLLQVGARVLKCALLINSERYSLFVSFQLVTDTVHMLLS